MTYQSSTDFFLASYNTEDIEVWVRKGPLALNYEGIELILASKCEWDLWLDYSSGFATQSAINVTYNVNTYFLPSCFFAQWQPSFLPLPPATSLNPTIRLVAELPSYQSGLINNASSALFQYRRAGQLVWNPIVELSGPPPPASRAYYYDWTLSSNLFDGDYELSVQILCVTLPTASPDPIYTTSETEITTLTIDFTPFISLGVNSPIDRPLMKGEAVVLGFNKDLDCPLLHLNATPQLNTSTLITTYVSCEGNQILVKIDPISHDQLQGKNFILDLNTYSTTGYELSSSFSIPTG